MLGEKRGNGRKVVLPSLKHLQCLSTRPAPILATSQFTSNSVGLLFGGGSSVDQTVFSNVKLSVIPKPSGLGLIEITAGAMFLRLR